MAFVGPLHKLVFGGFMGADRATALETWSCSIHVAGGTGELTETNMEAALTQWILRTTTLVNSSAWLEWFKYNQVDPVTGKYTNAGAPHVKFISPGPVRGKGGPYAYQIAFAHSWVTDVQRGYGSKGRIFVPGSAGVAGNLIGADGTVGTANATAMSVSSAQLITDLNGSVDGNCVVWSARGLVAEQILACRVGTVPDTQRRRRRSLVEVYGQTPVS